MRGSDVFSGMDQRGDADEMSRCATEGQRIGGTDATPTKAPATVPKTPHSKGDVVHKDTPFSSPSGERADRTNTDLETSM